MNRLNRGVLSALTLVAAAAAPGLSHAFEFTGHIGIDVGGDKLATAVYENGTTSEVKAGQLFHLAGGIVQAMNDTAEFEVTFGYKMDSAGASNGNVTFDRFPLEGLVFARGEKFRGGGGLTYHLAPTLDSSGDARQTIGTIEFDNALGFIVQGDWLIGSTASLGVRATFIDYDTKAGYGSVKGNSLGLVMSGRWD